MTAQNIWCILWIPSDLQIRGEGWIELTLLLHAHKLHRLSETYTELECFALLRAVQQHLWLQWETLPKMLCQWTTNIFPPSHCTVFPGAGSRTVSHLLLIRWKWAQIWKKWGEAFLVLQQLACFLLRVCICSEGAVFALLASEELNFAIVCWMQNYAESEHLSEIAPEKRFTAIILRCCLFLCQILLVLFTYALLWLPCFLQIPPHECFLCFLSWICSCSSLTSTS